MLKFHLANTVISDGDVIEVRYFKLIQETFIPPSAAKLGISAVYKPRYIIDQEFNTPQTMIVGHDGSKTLCWGPIEQILFYYCLRN